MHFSNNLMCLVIQSCPTLCNPIDYSTPGSSVHGLLQARILEWVACLPPGDLPNPGIKPRSPSLKADTLPSEPPGKYKNTGVSSLSLLQEIFLTQDQKQVSHIAGRFYTSRATRKALLSCIKMYLYNKYINNKTTNSIKANE